VLLPPAVTAETPGGFMEAVTSTTIRRSFTIGDIEPWLPARGAFSFPSPYETRGARLTNASDCDGMDCVHPVGYAYWRNMNNHVGRSTLLIFLGLNRKRGGPGPSLFSYDKRTEELTKLGPLFSPRDPLSWASGEGWYFSATQPTTLYMTRGPRLLRYDVTTRKSQTVLDVSSEQHRFGHNRIIGQTHSSNDDRVHSGTLKDGRTYAALGCLAYQEPTGRFFYFPSRGHRYDECQIDKSGRWLLIKEKLGVDPRSEVDNRIIDLTTGDEAQLLDRHGAGGHSDNGYGYMVAADNHDRRANAIKLWRFGVSPLEGALVYHGLDWGIQAPNHVSHANARAGVPPQQQYVCGSSANRTNKARANEIICFMLDGSLRVLVVAPTLTDMNAAGGRDKYSKVPKGNLDVTGTYFVWTSNLGSRRLDALLVRVPTHLLSGDTRAAEPKR
jgi:hypothetical protein